MKRDSLYIIMPAYNEEANIEKVIEHWHPIVEKVGGESRLVVLNDGSKDSTYSKIRECEKKYPRLIGIDKPNEGHGATILRGYHYAVDAGADYIFQTDSDGQTMAEEFGRFWKDRKSCGLLIGYRKGRKDGISRVFVTKVLRLVLFAVFGIWVKDANTPYRLMKASQLQKVLEKIPEGFDYSNVLMTVIYEKYQMGVRYYPITFRPRQGGKNSINMKRIVKLGTNAVRDFRKVRKTI
ncbi:MAG: glycosyltransferase family 2 protein [Eubacteriales bacterium]|nr:glycosyltransferase family 2 protein [Eubacteriales bacterium]